ncbi:hypothetical protein ATANTOWER_006041 [Ataeniobius toweri]|uniref:Uncharacterized protein n=1 Tax=Ataeniobius toweri TaxID=208326 RepID=A0ABU7BMR2_9TELE|nr:hypothetical protein [Ataeniobius toweri]
MGTLPQVSFIPEKLTKRHPHSASSTHSPAPNTPATSRPHHTAPRATLPQPPPTGTTGQTPPSTAPTTKPRPHTKMEQTHPSRGPHNHTDTPHHCHCNDSPGRSIIQLSSTTAAQPIQMPWVMGEMVPISSSLRARGRVHPGQVASPSQGNTERYRINNHARIHSHLRAIHRPINITVMFLDCGRKSEHLKKPSLLTPLGIFVETAPQS